MYTNVKYTLKCKLYVKFIYPTEVWGRVGALNELIILSLYFFP